MTGIGSFEPSETVRSALDSVDLKNRPPVFYDHATKESDM